MQPTNRSSTLQRKLDALDEDESGDWGLGLLDVLDQTMQELVIGEQAFAAITMREACAVVPDAEDFNGIHEATETCNALEAMSDSENNSVPETQKATNGDRKANLLTLDDVSKALMRNSSHEAATVTATLNETAVAPSRPGIRMRRQGVQGQKKSDSEGTTQVPGIFGTTTKPGRFSLGNYLHSVGSTKEKRIVALSAWVLSTAGLIVALCFVTKDFLESKRELSSAVRYSSSESLELPNLFFCNVDVSFQPFLGLPDGYPGMPTMWIENINIPSANISVVYPDTISMPQISIVSIDRKGMTCQGNSLADPVKFYKYNLQRPECFYCFAMVRKPSISLQNTNGKWRAGYKKGTGEDASLDTATFRLGQSRLYDRCRLSKFGLSGNVLAAFADLIRLHSSQLTTRGILDFGGIDPTDTSNDQYLWPQFRRGSQNGKTDLAVSDVVDMFCNVYLFSSYFYPASEGEVSFRFDNAQKRWQRSGKGPYYPPKFSDFYFEAGVVPKFVENSSVIGQEKFENRSAQRANTFHVYTNQTAMKGLTEITCVQESGISRAYLRRTVIKERESFTSHNLKTKLGAADIRGLNYVFFLTLSFDSFLTRVVSDQTTVSWSAFFADFFGLMSMFLDVSVYTVIVSPMVVRARRQALLAREQRRVNNMTV